MGENTLRIDNEFRDLLGSLGDEEREQLKANLQADGLRDSIIVWDEHETIIDGHNRYELCLLLGIPVDDDKIIRLPFDSRADVMVWIFENNHGRRNMKRSDIDRLIGTLYNERKASQGGDRKSKRKDCALISTAEQVAAETHVSPRKVQAEGAKVTAVKSLSDPAQKIVREAPIKGDAKLFVELAKYDDESQLAILADSGNRGGLKGAIKRAAEEPEEPAATSTEESMKSWSTSVESFARKITALMSECPAGDWATDTRRGIILDQLKAAAGSARQLKGYGICPKCKGEGCKPCLKTGWMPKTDYESNGGR